MKTLRGIVHGQSIELLDDVGMPEGTPVEVVLRTPAEIRLQRLAEIMQRPDVVAEWWTEEDDRILAEIEEDRRQFRHLELDLNYPE